MALYQGARRINTVILRMPVARLQPDSVGVEGYGRKTPIRRVVTDTDDIAPTGHRAEWLQLELKHELAKRREREKSLLWQWADPVVTRGINWRR